MRFAVIHGPNLNLLGSREPETYGAMSLPDLDASLLRWAQQHSVTLTTFQSNSEGELVTFIQSLRSCCDGIVVNPAAYTHTSVAIRDALLAAQIPTVEVHISNTDARESFRHRSLIADIVVGRIMGLGTHGYSLALTGLLHHVRAQSAAEA